MTLIKKVSVGLLSILFFNTAWAQEYEGSGSSSNSATNTSVTTATNQDANQRGAFGITYYFIGGQTFAANDYDSSSFDIFDSYLSFNYKVNKDLRFGARPAFGYSVEGVNSYGDSVDNKARVRDFSFVMTVYNVAEDYLPANITYQIQPRVYLPTSDDSKEQGLISKLRIGQEVKWFYQRYSYIRFYLTPNYYFQRSTTYLSNANPQKPNSLKTTALADSEHGVELSYSLNKQFSIKPGLNFIDKWSNESEANGLKRYRSTVVDYRLGMEVRLDRNVSFTFGLQSEQDLIRTDKSRELSYSLMTGGSLF